MEDLTNEILQLVKKKAREQAAYTPDEFSEIIDEALLYFKERGKMSEDENDVLIKEIIMSRLSWIKDKITS